MLIVVITFLASVVGCRSSVARMGGGIMRLIIAAAILAATGATPSLALSESQLVQLYCRGMITEFTNPDRSRTDCISATHAIEVDWADKYLQAIGQALHYAQWTHEFSENPNEFARWHRAVNTPRTPGIIFACTANRRTELCADKIVRPLRIAERYGFPLTIWDCDPNTDQTLADCQRIDFDPPAPVATAQ